MPLEEINERVEVLKDFGITLRPQEWKRIFELTSQMQLDNFIRSVIKNRWGMQEIS